MSDNKETKQAPAVEAGARDERAAWDGDSKESRTAFRNYDTIAEPVSRKTPWQIWRDACAWQARVALARASEAGAPAGYKLVPVEPTVEMKIAGDNAGFWCGDKWRAMLAAAPQPASEAIEEGCTPEDAKMLRAANHSLADENARLRRRLRPFAALANPRLSWAMVEYCIDGDPEKQTLQTPQMQRAFNRAAEALADELPSHVPVDCDALDLPDWIKNAKPPVPEQPASEQQAAPLTPEQVRSAREYLRYLTTIDITDAAMGAVLERAGLTIEPQAARGLSTAQIDAIRDSFSGIGDIPSRALVQRIAMLVLASAKPVSVDAVMTEDQVKDAFYAAHCKTWYDCYPSAARDVAREILLAAKGDGHAD
jgi:hypothetical protein